MLLATRFATPLGLWLGVADDSAAFAMDGPGAVLRRGRVGYTA